MQEWNQKFAGHLASYLYGQRECLSPTPQPCLCGRYPSRRLGGNNLMHGVTWCTMVYLSDAMTCISSTPRMNPLPSSPSILPDTAHGTIAPKLPPSTFPHSRPSTAEPHSPTPPIQPALLAFHSPKHSRNQSIENIPSPESGRTPTAIPSPSHTYTSQTHPTGT